MNTRDLILGSVKFIGKYFIELINERNELEMEIARLHNERRELKEELIKTYNK